MASSEMARRRNSSLMEVTFTGTTNDFKSGVTETLDPDCMFSSEFIGDTAYMEAADLSKSQVHTISACNLSTQQQTDPMIVTVVPARGSTNPNSHLNTLRLGGRGNNQLVLMSTRSSNIQGGEEVVYKQNDHASEGKIQLFNIDKLRNPEHTSIIPEQVYTGGGFDGGTAHL